MDKKKVNLYGWTDKHTRAMERVYKQLCSQHVPGVERNGKPWVGGTKLYLLERAADKPRK